MKCDIGDGSITTVSVDETAKKIEVRSVSEKANHSRSYPILRSTSSTVTGLHEDNGSFISVTVNKTNSSLDMGIQFKGEKKWRRSSLKCAQITNHSPDAFAAHSINEERLSGCVWGAYNIKDKYKKITTNSVKEIVSDCKSKIVTANWEKDPSKPDLGNFAPGCMLGVSAGFLSMKSSIDLTGMTQQGLMSIYQEICMGIKKPDLAKIGHRT